MTFTYCWSKQIFVTNVDPGIYEENNGKASECSYLNQDPYLMKKVFYAFIRPHEYDSPEQSCRQMMWIFLDTEDNLSPT